MITALAPMDGYTDCAFREIVKKYGAPDFLFTEFVSAQGLVKQFEKFANTLQYTEFQRPIIAQLFGTDPKYFYLASLILCKLGFDGIDINMGCPAKNISLRGSGAGLIKNPKLALKIIEAVKKARDDYKKSEIFKWDCILEDKDIKKIFLADDTIQNLNSFIKSLIRKWKVKVKKSRKITVSVKTRIGFDTDITEKWVKTLSKAKPDFITIHARTFSQGFKGKADWHAIAKAVKSTDIPIVGNGDVVSYEDAKSKSQKTGCYGVMIGRAALGNPFIFNFKFKSIGKYFKDIKFKVMLEHSKFFQKFEGGKKFFKMRKHLVKYVSNFPNARNLRAELSRVQSYSDVKKIISNYKKLRTFVKE